MRNRIQASVLFPKSSGMATWCKDQMVYINKELANKEQEQNKVVEVNDDNDWFICDLLSCLNIETKRK